MKTTLRRVLAVMLLAVVAPMGAAAQRAKYTNPVVPYDYPDPSVIRVGSDYWAVATAGAWAPVFTVMHSRDLVNWDIAGSVFPDAPEWAAFDFWAPELVEYRGRYFVYYTGRKKDGPLCVGVASADVPAGPYTDVGPIVCQEDGSIDADMAQDANGDLYLLWKEDANSRGEPTPIWAQKLAADGVTLEGEKTELIRNDVPWEGGVVEGPYVLWHEGWYYLFYSGAGCCGRGCNYALGVARARSILGPWEKNPANPILAGNADWRCPGHGTIVEDEMGRDFLMYHAYRNNNDYSYIGRMAMIDQVRWKPDGWPEINKGRGPSGMARAPFGTGNVQPRTVMDEFSGPQLDPHWRWLHFDMPGIAFENGALVLTPRPDVAGELPGAILARPHISGTYTATVRVDATGMPSGALAGIAALEWTDRALGIGFGSDREVVVWKRAGVPLQYIASTKLAEGTTSVFLKIACINGNSYQFAYSRDGKKWTAIGGEVGGTFLDYQQLALTAGSAEGAFGRFDSLSVKYK